MFYDLSISDGVSLSRILDEMVMGGSSRELTWQFLEGHAGDLCGVFRHSAFGYDLFDVARGVVDDGVLRRCAGGLGDVDLWYVGASRQAVVEASGGGGDLGWLGALGRGRLGRFVSARRQFCGHVVDRSVGCFDEGLVEALEGLANREGEMGRFVCQSCFLRSAMGAWCYRSLSTLAGYSLLREVGKVVCGGGGGGPLEEACGWSLFQLMKQLLLMGLVEEYGWVRRVVEGQGSYGTWFRSGLFGSLVPAGLWRVMCSGGSLEDLVFEHGLQGGQADSVDLFVWVNLLGRGMWDEAVRDPGLLEMLDLPFDLGFFVG